MNTIAEVTHGEKRPSDALEFSLKAAIGAWVEANRPPAGWSFEDWHTIFRCLLTLAAQSYDEFSIAACTQGVRPSVRSRARFMELARLAIQSLVAGDKTPRLARLETANGTRARRDADGPTATRLRDDADLLDLIGELTPEQAEALRRIFDRVRELIATPKTPPAPAVDAPSAGRRVDPRERTTRDCGRTREPPVRFVNLHGTDPHHKKRERE